ncbi:MAG: low molecular weight protein-tyrosine-phosphatase [Bacteroidia bacterium]
MIHVLFVCLGNICRSPLAEGIFLHKVKASGLEDHIRVDSCGTGGWHAGELADPRSREVAQKHGVTLPSRARKLRQSDFEEFDIILAMDRSNLRDLKAEARFAGKEHQGIYLMRDFDPEGKGEEVPDPYFGGAKGFDLVYEMLDRSTSELLTFIKNQLK